MFGAMLFRAVDTCYAKSLTGASKGGSDLKSLKIKTSRKCEAQMIQNARRRMVLPG
jgi:hypothetical protein